MIQRLGLNGHQPTIEESRKYVDAFINNGTEIPNVIRQQVLNVYVFNGNSATIDQMLKVQTFVRIYYTCSFGIDSIFNITLLPQNYKYFKSICCNLVKLNRQCVYELFMQFTLSSMLWHNIVSKF